KVFCDLVHMALTCDLTRVASLMFSMFQSHMNVYALTGQKCDLHELGHNGDPASKGTLAVSKMIAWHMKHFAYLIGKLRDTSEGAGSLLDNVALVCLHVAATGKHPANILITAMNAVGISSTTLGEVTGTIPGLLG